MKQAFGWLALGVALCGGVYLISSAPSSVAAPALAEERAEMPEAIPSIAPKVEIAAASSPQQRLRPKGQFGRQILMLEEPFEVPSYVFREWKANGDHADRALIEYGGRVVVLNFWATWCGVCAKEMPKFDRLAGFVEHAPVDLIALSMDRDFDLAKKALDKRGYKNLRAYQDTDSVLSTTLGVRGVPTTFVVGPDGYALAVVQGPAEWDSKEAIDWLQSLAPVTTPAAPTTAMLAQ